MTNIYKITNTITGKAYIGATSKPVNVRWNQYVRDSRKDRCKDTFGSLRDYGGHSLMAECKIVALEMKVQFFLTTLNGRWQSGKVKRSPSL